MKNNIDLQHFKIMKIQIQKYKKRRRQFRGSKNINFCFIKKNLDDLLSNFLNYNLISHPDYLIDFD